MALSRKPIKKITDLRIGEFYIDRSLVITVQNVFVFEGIIKGKLCFNDGGSPGHPNIAYTVKQVEDIISTAKLVPLTKVEKAKFLLGVSQR